jgi:SAM-dependent methyltransferase
VDKFTRLVEATFKREVEEGREWTRPWLDLDPEVYRAVREGRTAELPAPYCHDPACRLFMQGVQGLDVLCLAGGGGQQSAVFSLLGARVTVLDLMEEQLAGDRAAAAHYGYTVRTVQGDMRDLSAFPDGSFDSVCQPISTLYTPDLRAVYREVQRVLRPGGLYYADFAMPLLYMAQNLGWDGSAYTLRFSQPYRRGEIRELADGRPSFDEGEPVGEYHHLLSDILNGLIVEGLCIQGVWESPRPDVPLELQRLPGDIPAQLCRYLPFGLSVVAKKYESPLPPL